MAGDVISGTVITVGTAVKSLDTDWLATGGAVSFQPISGAVYFTVDGVTPSGSYGFNAGSLTVWRITGDDRDHFKAIRQGSADAIVYCTIDRG